MKARITGRYRHKKTGGFYVVIALGRNESTLEEVVVYAKLTLDVFSVTDVWVRPRAEFEDGRFEEFGQ